MSKVFALVAAAGLASANIDASVRRHTENEVKWTLDEDACTGGDFGRSAFGAIACNHAQREFPDSIQPNCLPRLHRPPAGEPVTSAVILIHGYTACPDQQMDLAETLAKKGAIVYTPLIRGHGREHNADCDADNRKCVNGDNVEEMPQSPSDYFKFSRETYKAFKTDIARIKGPLEHIGILGLSVGSAIATQMMIIDNGELFTRGVIGSPWLGLDEETLGSVPNFAIGMLTSRWSPLGLIGPIGKILETEQGWGGGCEVERANGRGGYCNFRQKNILAAHAFADSVVNDANQVKTKGFDAILVEKDGSWRNGMVTKLLRRASHVHSGWASGITSWFFGEEQHSEVHMCLFPIQAPVDGLGCGQNRCAVPHSNLARSEALVHGADAMWWETELHSQIADSLLSDVAVGSGHGSIRDAHPPKKDFCYSVDVQDPPSLYVDLETSEI